MLFGTLSKFVSGQEEVLSEQILNGLVTLLLHLQDPKPDVVKVSDPLCRDHRRDRHVTHKTRPSFCLPGV